MLSINSYLLRISAKKEDKQEKEREEEQEEEEEISTVVLAGLIEVIVILWEGKIEELEKVHTE